MTQHYWLEKGAAEGHHQEAKKNGKRKGRNVLQYKQGFSCKKIGAGTK